MGLASPKELAERGIFTFDTLEDTLEEQVEWIMENLITDGSVNLLAGDSGIGKTPLIVMMALCIAGGIPFLGLKVPKPRRVLYCDAESSRHAFHKLLHTISKQLGFKSVPKNFHVWSPNWDATQHGLDYAGTLFRNAEWNGFKPEVVFVDPLRVFFPEADTKREKAVHFLTRMRRSDPSTWFIIHHTRKPSIKDGEKPPKIEDDPYHWFHEVAGQHAIINHVDTRLGLVATPLEEGSELTFGGFVRMRGPIPPIYLARSYNDEGEPLGYIRASSLDLLKHEHYKDAFHKLPGGGQTFTFSIAAKTLGKSDSSAHYFLQRCISIGAVKKVPGGYVKTINS